MRTKTIGVREFRQNFEKIERAVKRGQSFVVTRHQKPIFHIHLPQDKELHVGKQLIKDFEGLMFKGDPDLSQRIDEIVYEDRR